MRISDWSSDVCSSDLCIADPDLADWFALAGIDAVPVTLDGKPKLLARSLADPALVALEPGLELGTAATRRQRPPVPRAEACCCRTLCTYNLSSKDIRVGHASVCAGNSR